MSTPPTGTTEQPVSTEQVLAAAGIETTAEGRERARARLHAGDAQLPEGLDAIRAALRSRAA